MATTAKNFRQDMPPAGGYGPIQWERIKLKTVFGVKATLGCFILSTSIGIYGYYLAYKLTKREELEMRSARFAILPMLLAERDRAFLKQCRINRDEERELMKDVPEWDVGTYFREPIYITTPETFREPKYMEFMAHADFFDTMYRPLRRMLSS